MTNKIDDPKDNTADMKALDTLKGWKPAPLITEEAKKQKPEDAEEKIVGEGKLREPDIDT